MAERLPRTIKRPANAESRPTTIERPANAESRPTTIERPANAESRPTTIDWWAAFYAVIRRVPRGRVTTYGAVAAMAGHPRASRHVGHALAAVKETGVTSDVPWHRVLGSRSKRRAGVSILDPVGGAVQRAMLEAEGVRFDGKDTLSLDTYGWFETQEEPATKKKKATSKRGAKAKLSRGGPRGR